VRTEDVSFVSDNIGTVFLLRDDSVGCVAGETPFSLLIRIYSPLWGGSNSAVTDQVKIARSWLTLCSFSVTF